MRGLRPPFFFSRLEETDMAFALQVFLALFLVAAIVLLAAVTYDFHKFVNGMIKETDPE